MTDATTAATGAADVKVADTAGTSGAAAASSQTTTTAATQATTQAAAGSGGDKATTAAVDTGAKAPAKAAGEMWSEQWREEYAAQDEKRLNQLKRYASPKAALDALFAAQQKISSGQLKETLAKDATPEQVTQWRKDNGIPETWDKYDTKLDNGLVIGEADKPIVNKFLEKMHGSNASPEQVKSALNAYYEIQKDYLTQREELDQNYRNGSEDKLRAEWGSDYQRNLNMVVNLRDQMPEALQDRIFGGRTSDGKTLGDDPEFLNWFHSVAGEVNPVGSIMPSGTSGSMENLLAEKAGLEKKMGTKAYGQPERARYAEIVDVESKLKGRAA